MSYPQVWYLILTVKDICAALTRCPQLSSKSSKQISRKTLLVPKMIEWVVLPYSLSFYFEKNLTLSWWNSVLSYYVAEQNRLFCYFDSRFLSALHFFTFRSICNIQENLFIQ